MSPSLLAELREAFDRRLQEEGEAAGVEFKQEPGCLRLANLADKGEVFRRVLVLPKLLKWIRLVLGPEIKLSSLNERSALPGVPKQVLHADMGGVPDVQGPWVCNSIWMLDGFTPQNGTLRVVPSPARIVSGSCHRRRSRIPSLRIPTKSSSSVRPAVWPSSMLTSGMEPSRTSQANRDAPCTSSSRAVTSHSSNTKNRCSAPRRRAVLTPEQRAMLALDDPLNDELTLADPGRSGLLK